MHSSFPAGIASNSPEYEPAPALELRFKVGTLAGRIAELLQELPDADQPPLRGAVSFLQAMYRSVDVVGSPDTGSHPFDLLTGGLGLTDLDADLLVMAGMPEEHEGLASVLRVLNPRGEPRPTVGLAAQVFCQTPGDRFRLKEALVAGAAVRSGAIRLGSEGPFFERSLELCEGLWPALCGTDHWPESLGSFTHPAGLAGLAPWLAGEAASLAVSAISSPEPRTILVLADSEDIALERGVALASWAGTRWARLAPSELNDETERLIGVHALLRGAVPVVRVPSPDAPNPPPTRAFLDYPGPVVLCGRAGSVRVRGARPIVLVPIEHLVADQRRQMWLETLPELGSSAGLLASRHLVEPFVAAEAAADARSIEAIRGGGFRVVDVASCVRSRAGLSLTGAVKLVKPTAGWDQLILTPDRTTKLKEAVSRLRLQSQVIDDWGFLKDRPGSRGVRMLFSGRPGTGKTLSAEVVARELGVELLVVDISRVVSKWIGETEKNLAEVFDTAERVEAVLLFDEADALFGKRTEVTDSHDRYANLETAYMLTRLERFEGLAILSTNLRQNIDAAFVRRLEFAIDFNEPGSAEREALWRCHVPSTAPISPEVRFSELARLYPLVGGVIRNASVAAGFLAAAEDQTITMHHFVRAIRREYEKSGRPFPGVPSGVAV